MILPSMRGFIGIFLLILKLISVAASWKKRSAGRSINPFSPVLEPTDAICLKEIQRRVCNRIS